MNQSLYDIVAAEDGAMHQFNMAKRMALGKRLPHLDYPPYLLIDCAFEMMVSGKLLQTQIASMQKYNLTMGMVNKVIDRIKSLGLDPRITEACAFNAWLHGLTIFTGG